MQKLRNKTTLLVSLVLFLTIEVNCWEKMEFEPTLISEEINKYLLELERPKYDSLNPEHFLINQANNGWIEINNPAYSYFFVEPGKYKSVNITQSGTTKKPRYICLQNDNDIHPAQLSEREQANVPIEFMGVENWIVDRLSVMNYNDLASRVSIIMRPVCKNIILNRMYFYNFNRAVEIQSNTSTSNYTKNITIQNCRMERMSVKGLSGDNIAILLNGSDIRKFRKIEDVHIINNEIVNCNDGIHAIHTSETLLHEADYAGLIIDGNHIYVNSDVYTDGNGNHKPNGIFALTENAIDLKAGSDYSDKPIIISNNYLWGFRKTDIHGGGSGDPGVAIVGHFDVKNVIIKDNVIFDSNCAISFRDPGAKLNSCQNITISNNIVANIGETSKGEAIVLIQGAINSIVEKNIIVANNVPIVWFVTWSNGAKSISASNNVIINMKAESGDVSNETDMKNNFYYNTPSQNSSHGKSFPNISDAHMTDLTFTTDRFTNQPRIITISGVVSTSESPHRISK